MRGEKKYEIIYHMNMKCPKQHSITILRLVFALCGWQIFVVPTK